MKSIPIDFASRTIVRFVYRMTWITWTLLAVTCVLCFYTASTIKTILTHTETERRTLDRLHDKIADRTRLIPASRKVTLSEGQVTAVNAAIAQLNVPWRDVLTSLEQATPASIALLTVEPNAKQHTFKCVAEAKNSDEMIGFIESLKQQEFFIQVTLLTHDINEQDVNKPIRFQVEVRWMERS